MLSVKRRSFVVGCSLLVRAYARVCVNVEMRRGTLTGRRLAILWREKNRRKGGAEGKQDAVKEKLGGGAQWLCVGWSECGAEERGDVRRSVGGGRKCAKEKKWEMVEDEFGCGRMVPYGMVCCVVR